MGTVVEKLQKALDNKASIKQSLSNKRGKDVGDNQSTWASEIDAIEPLLDTLNITENGEHDVKDYKNVSVLVESESDIIWREYIERKSSIIKIPYGTERIGTGAFARPASPLEGKEGEVPLQEINIPISVKSIGHSILNNMESISTNFYPKINYDGSLLDWLQIKKGYQIGNMYMGMKPYNQYSLPSGIEIKFKNSNGEYENIKDNVDLSSVTKLPLGAFSGISLYKNGEYMNNQYIVIPKSLIEIGNFTFYNFNGIETIEFEDGYEMETLPIGMFQHTNNFTKNSLKANIILPKVETISRESFFYSKVYTIEMKEGLITIDDNAFYECANLKELHLPQSLETINSYAFYNDTSLTELTLPKNITNIGSKAFYSCSKLKIINIEAEEPFTLGSKALPKNSGMRMYVKQGKSETFKKATNWSGYASYIFEKYSVVFNIPTALLNNDTITYSIDDGKTYQQFTNGVLSLNDISSIKIKSTDSSQTILIGTSSGGNDVGTISNSEITFSFTTDTNVYLTIQ